MKKLMKTTLIAAVLAVLCASAAWAGSWQKDSVGWWWLNDDGSWPASEWEEIGSAWYYFDGNGYMAHDTWIGQYYVGSDGAWIPGAGPASGSRDFSYARILRSDPMLKHGVDSEFGPAWYGSEIWEAEITDLGDCYQLGNVSIYKLHEFPTREEAEAYNQQWLPESYEYRWINENANGTYSIVSDIEASCEDIVWTGNMYVSKDATVYYTDYDAGVARTALFSDIINGGSPSVVITGFDSTGYITSFRRQEWG